MGIIAALISTVICTVLYIRMYKREVPEPIGKLKAAFPVLLGVIAVIISTVMVMLIGLLLIKIRGVFSSVTDTPLVIQSLVRSFFLAGFTEELAKLLMFLLVIRVCKPRNVYEYGMLCAGIGFGFTALEDVIYGGVNPVSSVFRVFFFAMHMMFGLLMGLHLGLARYKRKEGSGDARKHTFLAFLLPVLWHTVFDASTTTNAAFSSDDDITQIVGLVIALVVLAVSITLQIVLLIRFKKKTEEFCRMCFAEKEGQQSSAEKAEQQDSAEKAEQQSLAEKAEQ